jgi:hypothetical protein
MDCKRGACGTPAFGQLPEVVNEVTEVTEAYLPILKACDADILD